MHREEKVNFAVKRLSGMKIRGRNHIICLLQSTFTLKSYLSTMVRSLIFYVVEREVCHKADRDNKLSQPSLVLAAAAATVCGDDLH